MRLRLAAAGCSAGLVAASCTHATSPVRVVLQPVHVDAGSAAPAPAADTFCDDMTRASKVVLARLKPKAIDLSWLELSCAHGKRGDWALRADDAILTSVYDQETVGLAVVLVHRDAHGQLATATLPSDTVAADNHVVAASFRLVPTWGSRRVTELVAGDVDGDGDPEVFVAGGVFDEGENDLWGAIYTFRDGAVTEYPPAHGLDAVGFEDADKDGRFDVRTRGPYAAIMEANAMPAQNKAFSDAIFLAHAQPNGTFSLTDPVARADLEARCASTHAIVKDFDENDAKLRIVCERSGGKTAAQVRAELTAACSKFVEVPMNPTECSSALLEIADVVPP